MRGVKITDAGGVVHATLRLTINAMCEYEDVSGVSIFEAIESLNNPNLPVRTIRQMISVFSVEGLGDHDAGQVMDRVGLIVASRFLGDAIREAFPEQNQNAEADAPGK